MLFISFWIYLAMKFKMTYLGLLMIFSFDFYLKVKYYLIQPSQSYD